MASSVRATNQKDGPMVFEQIEKLKREFTDKYVVVDGERPELRGFKSMTGIVKTVNMNGRALVQFDENQNTGWFDIDLDCLKIVDAPAAKSSGEAKGREAASKPAADKPAAGKAGASPAASPAKAPAKAAGPKPGAGPSVADILAAARGGTAAKPASPAAAKPAAPSPSKTDAKKPAAAPMSVADILAAARSGQPAPASAPPVAAPAAEPVVQTPAAPPSPAVSAVPAKSAAPAAKVGDLPKATSEILAFCRQRDGA